MEFLSGQRWIAPISINHPQRYERPLAHFGGASRATQLYCPPATGYAEHISASEYATVREKKQTATHPQIMVGGPPDSTPMMRTPLNAVQEVTMLNEKPTIPSRLKLRFNSVPGQSGFALQGNLQVPCV